MTLPLPRFIEPASIDIGDTVRASWKVGDVEHTRTGVVGSIEAVALQRVVYSKSGEEIYRYLIGSRKLRVTLLKEAPAEKPALFNM
jgi:hypothetical protein